MNFSRYFRLLVAGLTLCLGAIGTNALAANPMIAAVASHSLALKSDGTVTGWGANAYGQTTIPAGLANVSAIATGEFHSLALKSGGTVAAWGNNSYGQTTIPAELTNVTAVAAGRSYSLALKSDGTVAAWGTNASGQTTVPPGLASVTAIAAGAYHALALKSDGTVAAWGQNGFGQTTVPAGLAGVVAVAAGMYHSLALKSDGTVVAWGYDGYTQSAVPAGLSNVAAIAAGGNHSLALKPDGTVAAWGAFSSDQTTIPAGLSSVVALAGGDGHSLALKSDGTVVAWGCTDPATNRGQCAIPTGLNLNASATPALAQVAATISDARVFAFAEANVPGLFAGTPTSGQTTYQNKLYNYRYYPISGNYLAVDTSGVIYILGPYTGNAITPVGAVSDFAPAITAWETGGGNVPTVTGLSPSTGAAGTTVTITGANFSTTPANNTVKFNGTQATVTAATATSLTVTVPSGATTGTVSVATAGGTAISASSFTVSAAPALSINPASLTFLSQIPGTSSAVQTVTLTNTGTAVYDLGILFPFPSDFIKTTTCGTNLSVGASCTIGVSFSPTLYGALNRTESVSINAAGTLKLNLSGPVPPLPLPAIAINFTPAVMTFPSLAVGTSSAAQSVTVFNTGSAPLDFTCIETPKIDGSSNCYIYHLGEESLPTDYTQTNTCRYDPSLLYPPGAPQSFIQPKANLAAGASCTISVTFTPQRSGARNGVLIIDSNAADVPNLRVQLNGNATTTPTISGTLSGSVRDAITNAGLSGVTVNIYSDGSLVTSVITDASGIYTTALAVGTYSLNITKVGYINADISNVVATADVTTTVEAALQISTSYSGAGTVSGAVKDAFTGLGKSGVTLNFRRGINTTAGSILATVTTGTSGTYTVSALTSGSYTAEAILNGYTTAYFTVTSVGGLVRPNQDGTITPTMASGTTRAVLTWGATPSDLDTHLTGPTTSGSRFHIYYSNRGSVTATPFANLDVDDTSSYGPETATISQQASGIYRYSVYDYTNRSSLNSTALSTSGAQVRVYQGGSLVNTFNVPAGQGGTLWTVFELNGTTITPVNTMSYNTSQSTIP